MSGDSPGSGSAPDFRILFEAAPDLYLVLDPELRIVAVSDNYLRATLTERTAIMGRGIFEVFPDNPDDPTADGVRNLKASLYRVLGLRQADTMPLQKYDVERPDGSGFEEKYWKPANTPVLDAKGEVQWIIHRAEDVTEATITARSKAESEALLSAVFQQAPVFQAVLDPDGSLREINALALEQCGYRREDEVGLKFWDNRWWQPSETTREFIRKAHAVALSGQVFRGSSDYFVASGERRRAEVSMSPVRGPDGGITSLYATFADVTEQEQTAQRYRFLSEALQLQLWTADPDGRVDYCNRATLTYLGCTQDDLARGGWSAQAHPEDAALLDSRWRLAVAGESRFEAQCRIRSADGHYRWHVIRANALEDGQGAVQKWFGSNADIDDILQARAAAEDAARAKAAFLSSMSHEIRTPMNAVIGMTSILQDSRLTPEQQEAADVIRSSGEHLLTVINDILDYSKIEAGKVELERVPFSLRECIETAMDLVSKTAHDKGVELGYITQPGTPEGLNGDVGRLRQVLVNLISNAVKFTPGRGQVMVEARLVGQVGSACEVEISVKDTGIGIDPETAKRLFRPFEQADASTTRTYGGSGLGLSICRRLVELMDGQISVESAPGAGSTFRFSFRAEPSALLQRLSPLNQVPALKGRRVLIVDDVEINRRILGHYTRLWGMESYETDSPVEALEWLRRGDPFDLALLDYHMPGMDGLTLARELRTLRSVQQLPVLMLSSVAVDGRADGAVNGSMLKPIKPSRLLDGISDLLIQHGHVEKTPAQESGLPRNLGGELPLRVLIAEDNMVNQKVAQLLFAKLGYQPDMVANGQEAIDAVERQIYDVVFMDVQMPVMDGLRATREICRLQERGQRPRIVGMSANVMEEDRRNAALAGMDDYVPKPVPIDQLVAALRRCTRRSAGFLLRPELFDAGVLNLLVGDGDDDAVRDLLDTFMADSEQALKELRNAVRNGDCEAIAAVAHQFKSTSAAVGANALNEACTALESHARAGERRGLRPGLQEIESQFGRLRLELGRQS